MGVAHGGETEHAKPILIQADRVPEWYRSSGNRRIGTTLRSDLADLGIENGT